MSAPFLRDATEILLVEFLKRGKTIIFKNFTLRIWKKMMASKTNVANCWHFALYSCMKTLPSEWYKTTSIEPIQTGRFDRGMIKNDLGFICLLTWLRDQDFDDDEDFQNVVTGWLHYLAAKTNWWNMIWHVRHVLEVYSLLCRQKMDSCSIIRHVIKYMYRSIFLN